MKGIQEVTFATKLLSKHHYITLMSAFFSTPQVAPQKPNEVWVGDITCMPIVNGYFLYLVVWMDLYYRRIVDWQLEEYLKEELIVTAFKKHC